MVQVDLCETCRSYWFDPGEFWILQKEMKSLHAQSSPTTTPQPILIHSAYEEYQKAREQKVRMVARLIILALLILNAVVIYQTKNFASQYYGVPSVRRRALDPAASAGLSSILLVLASINPRFFWWAFGIGVFYTFCALLVWAGRF